MPDGEDLSASLAVAAAVVDDPTLLLDVAAAVVDRAGGPGWTLTSSDTWCRCIPPDTPKREQGWKLHVSATLLSAPVVLSRVAEVLVAERCRFKFSRGLGQLRSLLSSSIDRGSGGKFITVYPADDAQFRQLAERLHAVTYGLPGPAILSDRPLRPGSLVHYRYGGFSLGTELTNEGAFQPMLTTPDGRRVPDERKPWFSPPSWAKSPFPAPAQPLPAAKPADSVILGDRFVVRKAIRHSYRGGVYRAVDQQTGADVVVKQARPHVMAPLDGTDARDRLRHEAEILDRLAPLGLAPHRVALFTQQDNVFLAEEMVAGVSLAAWAAERAVDAWRGQGPPVAEAVDLALQLVRTVAAVHAQDLVLRDLTPNNVMITPEGRPRLIDLEHATPIGTSAWKFFTVGYAAPEVVGAPPFGPAVQAIDLYSLGATLLHLTSGRRPLFAADSPPSRPGHERLAELAQQMGRHMPAVRHLAPLVLGLMHDQPERRWDLGRAETFLAGLVTAPRVQPRAETGDTLPDTTADRLLTDGLAHLLQTMTPQAETLWRVIDHGPSTDPCNLQHGAAGVLGVLTRATQVLGDHLRDGVARAAGWIDHRLFTIPRLLPGLYFGRSGTAWSLFDAAQLLGDEEAARRAIELAKRLPATWPNPDVCHGMAGAGLAYLHLWRATGDPDLERRVLQVADGVLAAANERDGRLLWPVPADFDSAFAGAVHYGFAHGVAGTGAFLLYASVATGRQEYLEAARRAGDTLEAVAAIDGGPAWWPTGEKPSRSDTRLLHWCSGSAGVGTFLVRLWAVTGEERFRTLAEAAGAAIRRDRWYSSTSTCHGLSGHGEFLLDLADFTADRRYRLWAGELAATIQAQHAVREGRMLVPDESGSDFTAGYNSGLSGTLGFLLRLRHGGPRWWMPDDVLHARPGQPAAPVPTANAR